MYFDGRKAGDPYRIGTVMAIRQVSLSVSEYRAGTDSSILEMLTLELSSIVLEIPNDRYTALNQNPIICQSKSNLI